MNASSERNSAPTLGKVLVFESDSGRASDLVNRLHYLNYEPVIARSGTDAKGEAAQPGVAAIVGSIASDTNLQKSLTTLGRDQPDLPLLLLDDQTAELASPLDTANHPVWKVGYPVRSSRIGRLLSRAKRHTGADRRHRITGNSPSVRQVRQLIEKVADFSTNVLITGESGTGKELAARTIHDLSDRCDQPFVPINCGAIPEELLESELFGHRKGSFTGAINDRVGRFELAEGGTLFLDEIGDMCLSMQVKLLRVLQERCFERVGSNESQSCNVRIIAATHCDLPAAVASGEFREDLFFRLNVFPIEMPCLRKRSSDLPALFEELSTQLNGSAVAAGPRLCPSALRALASYDWPGNVRELSNLVERLGIMKPTGEIRLEDLPAKIRESAAAPGSDLGEFQGADLKAHLKAIEQTLIEQAMASAGGVTAKAARLLGMQRTTLVEKLSRNQA